MYLTMVCVCIFMLMKMSPMKSSMCLVCLSLMVSMMTYHTSHSTFLSSALILSFSSGMMILFCYCAMMSSHEETKAKKLVLLLSSVATILLSCSSQWSMKMNPITEKMQMMMNTPTVMTAMSMVILSMICINKTIMSPSKPLMNTY